jgi:hypothetical protein
LCWYLEYEGVFGTLWRCTNLAVVDPFCRLCPLVLCPLPEGAYHRTCSLHYRTVLALLLGVNGLFWKTPEGLPGKYGSGGGGG